MPERTGAAGKTISDPRAKQMFQMDASEISPLGVWKTASSYPWSLAWRP